MEKQTELENIDGSAKRILTVDLLTRMAPQYSYKYNSILNK